MGTFGHLLIFAVASVAAATSCTGDDSTCHTQDGDEEVKGEALLQKNILTQAGQLHSGEEGKPKIAMPVVATHSHVSQKVAAKRAKARVRLGIESDLRKLSSKLRHWKQDEDCAENAKNTFQGGLKAAGLDGELSEEEKENFEKRFIEEMTGDCKYDPDVAQHWADLAAAGLEHQKPIVTEAFVKSINDANLGFTAKLKDSDKNMSRQDYDNLLGMDANLAETEISNNSFSFLQMPAKEIPETFDSGTKVPNCDSVVKKIHNQGTCGSCWAFGTMSAIDSRLCIATNGAFSGPKAALSRGYVTSCSTPGGKNGCNGGWWSFVYNLLGEGIHCDRRGGNCQSSMAGTVTGLDNGCIPYFGHGSGVDHFDSKSSAPPCQDQCVKNSPAYFRPFKEDLYVFPGGSSFASSAIEFDGYTSKANARKAREAIYEKGPLPFAIMADSGFQSYSSGIYNGECQSSPNHCTTAIGYGVDYFDSLNSWGPKWGDKGGFKMADCLITHWSVPPDMPTSGIPSIQDSLGPSPPGPGPSPPGPGPAPGPPAPTPNPPVPVMPVWAVTSGPCTVDGSGCMRSPNYKTSSEAQEDDECEIKAAKYGPNQTCTFEILTDISPAIEVTDFWTEKGFDIFTVNGKEFSGGGNDTEELHGIVPVGTMTWETDKGFEKTGWRLCPKDPREDMNYTGAFVDKNGTTFSMYIARLPGEEQASPWPDFQTVGTFRNKNGSTCTVYASSGWQPIGPSPPAPAPTPAGPTPAPAPAPPTPAGPTPAPAPIPEGADPEAPEWLLVHNYYRCIHDAGPIEWNNDVAAGSLTWAERGEMSHAKCYSIPAPRGPSGENLAMGYKSILAAVTAWYDENPEKGPSCGGHCTALLWQKSVSLGCGKSGKMYVCRYANAAANYGKPGSYPVGMPDYSKEPDCYAKFPVSSRWTKGVQSTMAAANHKDKASTVGEPASEVEEASFLSSLR